MSKTTKIKIEFANWIRKAALEIEASSVKEAVEKAVENNINLSGASLRNADLRNADLYGAYLRNADLSGADLRNADLSGAYLRNADLYGASLRNADLRNADLYGASLRNADLYGVNHNGKELWSLRPVLQLGCCGSVGRSTLVMFYADKSDPMVYCGCFSGTVDEFEKKIHDRHAGTFHEYEYMAMVEHIRAIRKYQLEVKDEN